MRSLTLQVVQTIRCMLGLVPILIGAGVMGIGGCGGHLQAHPRPIPVILDTDIGGDIDDMWAMGFLLASPELDVKLIVTEKSPAEKAKLVARYLQNVGREDIPIGMGVGRDGQNVPRDTSIEGYGGKVYVDGVQVLIDTIMNSKEPMTLLAIGPVPNIEVALQREPRLVNKARLVVMGGSIGRQEQGEPAIAEYNVRAAIKAAQKVYSAGWDVTMAPTDTAGKVQLEGEYYAQVRDANNPMAMMIMEQYRIWNQKQTTHRRDLNRTSSTLWDTVAVYLTFDESFCQIRDIKLSVTDQGITKPSPEGKLIHVAIAWKDLDAFHKLLAERISRFKP